MNLEATAAASVLVPPPAVPPTASPQLGLCLIGRDERGRPHASFFSADASSAAERAAALMGFSTLVVTDEHAALAESLAAGRIFASGKAFVPFCAKGVYERLLAAAGLPDTPMPVRAASKPAEPPPAPAGSKGGDGAAGGASGADGGPKSPTSWPEIARGSLVLACAGPMEGWFEAVVMYTKLNNCFELQWRDWPDLPLITRKRADLGLLPPGSTEGWR